LLVELEDVPVEGDVVIGGKERDKAEGEATDGLGQPKPVKTQRGKARAGGGA
jgi:hypothetical protein